MPALQSKIYATGKASQRNRARMLALLERLRSLEARTRDASARAKPLFDKRGQLLPRERIARLLDPGAPWLELSSMAGYCLDDPDPEKTIPGGGMVCGIGYVSGVRAMVAPSRPRSPWRSSWRLA
jgi:geranyl-CoA carboxylase beta subunit